MEMSEPRIPEGKLQRRRNVMLSDEMLAMAKAIGCGNVSAGIRLALSEAMERRGWHGDA